MRILVVEDEPLLAMLLEASLSDLGHDVAASAATVEQALITLGKDRFDAALLDFSLGHQTTSAPVARRLREQGTPFYYLSGHVSLQEADLTPDAPLLNKPVDLQELKAALKVMADGGVS